MELRTSMGNNQTTFPSVILTKVIVHVGNNVNLIIRHILQKVCLINGLKQWIAMQEMLQKLKAL